MAFLSARLRLRTARQNTKGPTANGWASYRRSERYEVGEPFSRPAIQGLVDLVRQLRQEFE